MIVVIDRDSQQVHEVVIILGVNNLCVQANRMCGLQRQLVTQEGEGLVCGYPHQG